MKKSRILSGIQPTNILHIGNYIGAIQQWVSMQNAYECLFCVVDLHAITVKQNPKELAQNIRKLAALYLACGVNPSQSIIFVQSMVSAHAELAWILNTVTQMSELTRMTQFKDKSKQHAENINVGLFDYPVLMAADILLYRPALIPVGDDQTQHVELTRTLARRFNTVFGDAFVVPKLSLHKEGARIMALDDPEKKMSKSAKSAWNYVALTDGPEVIRKKFRRAVTDSGKTIVFDERRKGLHNLLTIYKVFSGMSNTAIENKFSGSSYADFKDAVAEAVIAELVPLQERYHNWLSSADLDGVIEEGNLRANVIAEETLKRAQKAVGLGWKKI